jgi:Rod binding domain-containing protein
MNVKAIQPGALADPQASKTAEHSKIDKAAHDFEALLVSEMLKSSHSEGGGWLGTGDDSSGDTAVGMGEEQLAQALANGGGLGLAKMIEAGLSKSST